MELSVQLRTERENSSKFFYKMPLTVVQFEYAWEIHVQELRVKFILQVYLRLAGIYYTEENRNYPISILEGKRAYLIDGPYIVNEDHALQYLRENVFMFCVQFSLQYSKYNNLQPIT